MNPDTRVPLHMGINFVIAPMPEVDAASHLRFQQQLVEYGVDYSAAVRQERELLVERNSNSPLQVRVIALGPPSLGQLIIVAPNPKRELNLFVEDADAVVRAFIATWETEQRQVVSVDVTLRDLYHTSAEHAFKELWEERFHQPQGSLSALGRPILGGGVRFVMPPLQMDEDPHEIELKIESYLNDSSKLFVETQFKWPMPKSGNNAIDPRRYLDQVNSYVETVIEPFIEGDGK